MLTIINLTVVRVKAARVVKVIMRKLDHIEITASS
jgi:hypothetical protein